MTRRRAVVVGLAVLAVLGGLFTLWFTSADQQRARLVEELLERPGVVDSVSIDRDGIREVVFDGDATTAEILDAWELLDEENVAHVRIGEVRIDDYDMEVAASVALAAQTYVAPAMLSVREVGEDEVWLESTFDRPLEGPLDGTPETRPAEGAAAVLRVLEALPEELPKNLFLVAANRITKQIDLVVVERPALERLPETIIDLRRIAATDPDQRIVCDAEGCRTD